MWTVVALKGCPYSEEVVAAFQHFPGIRVKWVARSQTDKIKQIRQQTGQQTFPMIFFEGNYVGGWNTVQQYFRKADQYLQKMNRRVLDLLCRKYALQRRQEPNQWSF